VGRLHCRNLGVIGSMVDALGTSGGTRLELGLTSFEWQDGVSGVVALREQPLFLNDQSCKQLRQILVRFFLTCCCDLCIVALAGRAVLRGYAPWSPPNEARHPLRQAFQPDLLPCVSLLPYEASTPNPPLTPPSMGGDASPYLTAGKEVMFFPLTRGEVP
jgi:hypothetical protein